VPADAIGGVDHVLALLPPAADVAHAAEEKGAVLLRLDSEEEVGRGEEVCVCVN